jgi:hypothetical protein
MGTTWIIVGVGVAHLSIADSQFESFSKFFGIFCGQQSNSLDSTIVFDPHGFNRITWFPKEVSQLLHVDLHHPACHFPLASIFNDLFFNVFDCIKDDARLFVVTLKCEGLSTSSLTIADNCRIQTKSNRIINNILCFPPYNFLVSLFRKGLVKDVNFFFVISLNWLSMV